MKSITNLFWNSMNGIILAILSFIFTPLYSNLVGIENYGLINVWMISLVIATVFDFGINLTINNIISNNQINQIEKNKGFLYLEKKITLRVVGFFIISGIVSSLLYFVNFLSLDYLMFIILIAFSAYMQLAFQFYVNVFLGLQLHKKVNTLNILINCSKYLIGFILLLFFDSLLVFFIFQAILSLFQCVLLKFMVKNQLEITEKNIQELPDYKMTTELKMYTKNLTILSFASITLANLDRIWALIIDDLEFYGYYAIAFTGASFIQLIIQPFYKTYFAKYSSYSKFDYDKLLQLFQSSSIMCNGLLTITSVNLFIHSEFLLKLWLGDIYNEGIQLNFLLIVFGVTLSGFYWLPAAFMQSQRKPEFHNKMILYSIFFSFIVLVTAKITNLFNSPAYVWLVHGLILLIFESIHLHKKYHGFKIIYWIVNGIIIPLTIAIIIGYLISSFEFKSIIINVIQIVFSFIIPTALFLIISHNNKNLRNAF